MSLLIVLLAGWAAAPPAPSARPTPLEALAEAERAFARDSVERGIRPAFLAFFAPDGLAFQPAPENVHASYAAVPAPATRPPVTLDWAPVAGDISRSGDFGWTTGPYTLSDDRGDGPTRHGFYFSVWAKKDGVWKVVADFGTTSQEPAGSRPAFHAAHATPAAKGPRPSEDQLFALDRDLSSACAQDPLCLAARLHEGGRVHRDLHVPAVGAAAARALLEERKAIFSFEPLGGRAASSGDLAYTYGRYRALGGGGSENGYYLHVWRRTPRGWELSVDVAKAEPPAQP